MDTTVVPHRITLRSGHPVLVRAVRPDDGPGLAEAYDQLSENSRYRRFFTGKPHLSEQSLAYFTDVDHRDHEAVVAVVSGSGQLVGVARYIRIPGQPDQAEVAITVLDSWQRRGLGTVLLRELAQRAAEEGIRYFVADILAENRPMVTLAQRLGDAEITGHGDTVSARIDLTAATEKAGTSSYDGYDLLPAVPRGWLDLSEKIITTLLVPVRAFCDTSRQAVSTTTAPGQPEDPATTSQKPPRSDGGPVRDQGRP